MIVPRYYENLEILHEGTMPARAYYIPASRKMDCLVEHREESDRIQFLNGNWKFRFFESIYDVEERFFEPGYDTSGFGELKVPGVWQMAGYDSHQYTNSKYPFPFEPPYVPQDNPCGAYVHEFDYQKDDRAPKAYLNFEGVDSCFYVWLNGSYIGYSQVSHATSEFDVTSVLREGKNTIAVLVLKWCDGSYLEDQDKFRMNGIFRDVYLLKRPEQSVGDYRITTVVGEAQAEIRLHISYIGQMVDTRVTVYTPQDNLVTYGKVQSGYISLEIPAPKLWNAEQPNLYTLVIKTEDEIITDYVGFRTIEIKDKVVYLNGQKIKFHGVNRRDSDPVTGFAVSIEQLMKDLTMMKQHNFNAICSSHYPNAPYFYQLCDKYGFMVMDEADVEAHGPNMIYYKEDTDYNRFNGWNERIADDPVWEASILNRLVYPDRTPRAGLLEYKNVYCPARVVSYDVVTKELKLHNYLDFTDLKDYAVVCYEVSRDGVYVDSGRVPVVSVAPHGEAVVKLDIKIPETGRVYLKLIYRFRNESPMIPAGHVLGFDEILLENKDGRNQTAVKWLLRKCADAHAGHQIYDLVTNPNQKAEPGNSLYVTETDGRVVLKGAKFIYFFSKKRGLFESLIYENREYLNAPMEINLWRAPTDNDMYIKEAWKKAHYHEACARAYEISVEQSEDDAVISCIMSVSAPSVQQILGIRAAWTIDRSGGIYAVMRIVKHEEFPVLPRFGVRLFLPKSLEQVSYYGYGPMESYCDKHSAASHGLYFAKVTELHEDYICPRENGSHFDCDYVEISDGQSGLAVVSEQKFSFNASVYTQEELEEKAHNFELEESGSTVLCVDYALNGIGSNSCGPEVLEKYRFDDTRFCFEFKLIPFR